MNINPNYLAYANSRGLSVEDCKKSDEQEYPGGKMTGFILFISEQKAEFDKIHRPENTYDIPGIYNPNQKFYIRNTEKFHNWLQNKFNTKQHATT